MLVLNTIMWFESSEGSLSGIGTVSGHGRLDARYTVRIVKVKVGVGELRVYLTSSR